MAAHHAEPGDDTGGRCLIAVHSLRGQGCDLQERRAVVQEHLDTIARQELAALQVPLSGRLGTAPRCALAPIGEVHGKGGVGGNVDGPGGAVRAGFQLHPPSWLTIVNFTPRPGRWQGPIGPWPATTPPSPGETGGRCAGWS